MKKSRVAVLLLALLMALSMVTAAPAEKALQVFKPAVNGTVHQARQRMVNNGETVSLELRSEPYELIEWNGGFTVWRDVVYNFDGKLTATSNKKWIRVKNGKYGFTMGFDVNDTLKARSGKVTVTGKGFKATLKIKQYGKDQVASVKRNKDKVTVKLKYAAGAPQHYLSIDAYKREFEDEEQIVTEKNIFRTDEFSENSYSFKVEKGWTYTISVGPSFPFEYGTIGLESDVAEFEVESVTGKETYR